MDIKNKITLMRRDKRRPSNIRLTFKSVPVGLGTQLALLFLQVACQRICKVETVVRIANPLFSSSFKDVALSRSLLKRVCALSCFTSLHFSLTVNQRPVYFVKSEALDEA
jgi:presenilin-like A22 family membrane protease